MSVRQMPDVPASGVAQFAGAGISTGGGSGGSGGYSTDEIKTGEKWVDGKDIYSKTFSDVKPPQNDFSNWYIENVDSFVNITGHQCKNNGNNVDFCMVGCAYGSSGFIITPRITSSHRLYGVGSFTEDNPVKTVLTFYYTKISN